MRPSWLTCSAVCALSISPAVFAGTPANKKKEKPPKVANAPTPLAFVDAYNISDVVSSIPPISSTSPIYAALRQNRTGCGTVFTVTNVLNHDALPGAVARVEKFILESVRAASAFRMSQSHAQKAEARGDRKEKQFIDSTLARLPSLCGRRLQTSLMLHQQTLEYFAMKEPQGSVLTDARAVFDIIQGVPYDNTMELNGRNGETFEALMDREIPWFNNRFGGPNMGMRQVLAWALSPFDFTLVADGDVMPCKAGLAGLLKHLQGTNPSNDGNEQQEGSKDFDLVYGPPMFGMARSGNYRMGYRLLPEIRAAYDGIRSMAKRGKSPSPLEDASAFEHLAEPSRLAALTPTKPRKREVVVACQPYEPGAASGSRGRLHSDMPFECFREPNTGVMAFAMNRPNVRLLLLKAYDAYRRLLVGAQRRPAFFVGGSGTQYAFREAIWAMVHSSKYLTTQDSQQRQQQRDSLQFSLSDPAAQRPLGAPFRVAMLTSICRAMSCKRVTCGDTCLIIHSRKAFECNNKGGNSLKG